MKIHCPLCAYRPHAGDRWICSPGCDTVWNTFDTRARCPGCSKQWRVTACPACDVTSPHNDWYHDEALVKAGQQIAEVTSISESHLHFELWVGGQPINIGKVDKSSGFSAHVTL